MLKLITFLLSLIINDGMTAKILAVFPTPSVSHQNVYRTLIQELAKRGHEITLLTTDPFPKENVPANVTEINFQETSYRIWRKYSNIIASDQNRDVVFKMDVAFNGISEVFEQQLKTDQMKKLIAEKGSYYDLLLLESCVIPILSLSHLFNAPVILVNSFGAVLGNYEIVGAPTHPFLYPSNFRRRIYNLNVWEKISELYTHIRLELTFRSSEQKADLMLSKHFGKEFPSLKQLKNNVHMLFLNINPIWAGNHPVPSNVIFMGGIRQERTEELPQDMQAFLEKSRSVVYVSFGSNIKPSLLPPQKILVLLNVLSEIPYNVILKWDTDKVPGAPKNIKVFKWVPQSTLLKHPKIKLFITQGGLQSTDEAINAGVPLIGIPMFSDQWYNAEKYEHFNIGKKIDMETLSEEVLMDAIQTVIRNDSFRRNVAQLRELMQDQQQTPLERAIWWTEYVLRNRGAKHLRSPAANMSWAEYFEVDLIIKLLLMVVGFVITIIVSAMLMFRYIVHTYTDVKIKLN